MLSKKDLQKYHIFHKHLIVQVKHSYITKSMSVLFH